MCQLRLAASDADLDDTGPEGDKSLPVSALSQAHDGIAGLRITLALDLRHSCRRKAVGEHETPGCPRLR
ncbi:hypothetical protein D3C85_1591600 [compost metagenome]